MQSMLHSMFSSMPNVLGGGSTIRAPALLKWRQWGRSVQDEVVVVLERFGSSSGSDRAPMVHSRDGKDSRL